MSHLRVYPPEERFASHDVARAQIEPLDLARAHVDVVGAWQVVVVGRAKEAEAVGQHFERAVAEDRLALLRLVREPGED